MLHCQLLCNSLSSSNQSRFRARHAKAFRLSRIRRRKIEVEGVSWADMPNAAKRSIAKAMAGLDSSAFGCEEGKQLGCRTGRVRKGSETKEHSGARQDKVTSNLRSRPPHQSSMPPCRSVATRTAAPHIATPAASLQCSGAPHLKRQSDIQSCRAPWSPCLHVATPAARLQLRLNARSVTPEKYRIHVATPELRLQTSTSTLDKVYVSAPATCLQSSEPTSRCLGVPSDIHLHVYTPTTRLQTTGASI